MTMWKRALSVAVVALASTTFLVVTAAPAAAAPATPAFGPAIDGYAAFDPQDTCDPTDKPGVVSFKNLLAETYGSRWWNISRACNSEPGASEHKEGRALDYNFDVGNSAHRAQADDLLAWLLATDQFGNRHAMARRLGIMYIIWNRQVWGAYRAGEGWRPYDGSNPHTDHIHFSFSWSGARQQTTWWTARQTSPPVASAVYNGAFHVVGRAGNKSVVHTWFDGTWHTENLGGAIEGTPSIVVFNGQFHVVGANGGLVFHTYFNGSAWVPWQQISTGYDPVATVYQRGGVDELHVASRASSGIGSVVHTWYDGTWHTENLGGGIQGSASLVVFNGSFHVIGANGGMVFQTWFNGSAWQPWQHISSGYDPVATVYQRGGVSELHVASRASSGIGSVVHTWYDGTWHSANLGGGIQGRPTLVIYNGQFHVIGANGGQVYQTWYTGTTWFPWQLVSTGSGPTAVVYPHGGRNELHITTRASTGNLTDAWYDGTWHTQPLNGFA